MSQGQDLEKGLPLPTKEKVARWLSHGGVIALGVAGVVTFMPFINKALGLLLNGVWSIAELGMVLGATCFGAFGAMTAWPIYKKLIESCANKATWALFEYDPITPMVMWLKEVGRDRAELETNFHNICAVIAQNENMVQGNLSKADDADKKFAATVKKFGSESTEAQLMALEPSTLRQTAQRIQENAGQLYVVKDTLKEIVDATIFTQRKAELDVDAFTQEFTAAQNVERATNAASRVLKTRSERKNNAMISMKIIRDKYAGSLGRLQSLRELSREVILSVDMEKGICHQDALDRLKTESRFITGAKKPEMLEANLVGQKGGASFYKVSEPVPVRTSNKQ